MCLVHNLQEISLSVRDYFEYALNLLLDFMMEVITCERTLSGRTSPAIKKPLNLLKKSLFCMQKPAKIPWKELESRCMSVRFPFPRNTAIAIYGRDDIQKVKVL
jgi:hypothetical protein